MATNDLVRPARQPSARAWRVVLVLALLAPFLVIVVGAAIYLMLGPRQVTGSGTVKSPAVATLVLPIPTLPTASRARGATD